MATPEEIAKLVELTPEEIDEKAAVLAKEISEAMGYHEQRLIGLLVFPPEDRERGQYEVRQTIGTLRLLSAFRDLAGIAVSATKDGLGELTERCQEENECPACKVNGESRQLKHADGVATCECGFEAYSAPGGSRASWLG